MDYLSAILEHVVPIISEASKSQLGLISLVALIVLTIVLLFLYLTARTRPVLSFVLALVAMLLMFGGVVCRRQSGRRAARAPSGAGIGALQHNRERDSAGTFRHKHLRRAATRPRVRAPFKKYSPMRRLASLYDIKGLAQYLASPAARVHHGGSNRDRWRHDTGHG